LLADKPNGLELRQAIRKLPVKVIETLSDRSLYLRAVIAVPFASSSDGLFALQVIMAVPKNLVADAQSVETGFRDYQQLGFQREGLKRLFALTLTLAMLLTLFSAIALSFLLSERLSSPLSALADATRAIARGDFTRLNPVKSRDEFGVLTQSFNTMTRQLREASDVVATKQQQLENANAYLESILGHLTSGVITLDARMYVKTINKNAEDMLGFEYQALQGVRLPEWGSALPQLKSLIGEIRTQLANMRERTWERQIAFEGPHGRRTLLVRATKLPANIDSGFVFVFDDITGLIQAQRDAAWGEVARRLAHEIKNPLTPIQLSAERLQQKLANKLPPLEQDLLTRATNTIVAQVGALKGMVDDFSLYSRSSRLAPVPLDFNELVRDVLVLYESTTVSISTNLAGDIPMLMADPALMRQVLHNLIQNALDACSGGSNPAVSISTRIADNWVMLGVDDNGSGVREDVMASIFEPYVTTKPKGTGLGLAIVKKIVDEHRGRISVSNVKPHGASVQICLPIEISALGTAVSLSRAQQVEQ
jgi:nitrogen fixation/metabolism regulation signal transduction histidine kinase